MRLGAAAKRLSILTAFRGCTTRKTVSAGNSCFVAESAIRSIRAIYGGRSRTADWSIALAGAWFATAAILMCSTYLYRCLGQSVLIAIERLVGMLLVALSVQMFLDGIVLYIGKS